MLNLTKNYRVDAEKQKNRVYFQNVRAICILAVILIHYPNGLHYVTYNCWTFNSIFYIIERNLINFPVPVFFFLSGFFIKSQKIKNDIPAYYRSRIKKLLIPYLVWTTIYNFFYILIDFQKGNRISLSYLLNYVLGCGHLYFIMVLFLFTLITPLLIKCLANKYLSLAVFLISAVFLIIQYVSQLVFLRSVPFMKNSPIWICFYYAGICLSQKDLQIFNRKKHIFITICVICLCLEVAETLIMCNYFHNTDLAFGQMHITGFLYAFAIIFCILSLFAKKESTPLTILGNNSYGIYYVHSLFISIFSKIIGIFNISLLFLQQLIIFNLSLVLSLFAIYIIQKLFKKDKATLIFGV